MIFLLENSTWVRGSVGRKFFVPPIQKYQILCIKSGMESKIEL